MKQGLVVGVALFAGVVVGSAFHSVRDAMLPAARAEAPATHRYKVVDPSMGSEGYEEDLNKLGGQGWRFVGAITGPRGAGGYLVFER